MEQEAISQAKMMGIKLNEMPLRIFSVSDEVLKSDGSWKKVESVNNREGVAKAYNLEVFNNNYFVGDNGAPVHNEGKH